MDSYTDQYFSLNFIKDRLSHLLLVRWGYKGSIIFILIPMGVVSVISFLEGGFFKIPGASQRGLDELPLIMDYAYPVLGVIFIFTILRVRSLLENISYTFNRLWNRQLFSEHATAKEYKNFLAEFESEANNKFNYIIGFIFLLMGILNTFYWYSSPKEVITWDDPTLFPFTYLIWNVIIAFLEFLIGVFFWKGWVLVKCIRALFQRFSIQLQPLNPDKSAGLKPLGELSYKISRVLFLLGIYVVLTFATAVTKHPSLLHLYIISGIQMLIIYVILSIFLFIYPLMPAHNIMKIEKDRLLDQLSVKIGVLYLKFYEDLIEKGTNIEKERIEQLLSLKELYLEAGKMSVWPFDIGILIKFIGTVICPVLLVLTEMVLSLFII